MKKKIAITLCIVSLIFLASGTYIIATIESATSELNYLITLHQVEILREHLLLQIKKVQSDLILVDTRHARSTDVVVTNVRNMEQMTATCFDCHHSGSVIARLRGLMSDIGTYKNALSRSLTMRAEPVRLLEEKNTAFRTTEKLAAKVDDMVHMATTRLSQKTDASLDEISKSKIILYILVILSPFLAVVLGYMFTSAVTRPVGVLLEATRKIMGGDLDYRIKGLTDEFGEVAQSFNEMSDSLKAHMHQIQGSETRYRLLFETAGDSIFIMEAEGEETGKIVAANQAAAKMHGYTVEEILQLRIQDLDTPDAAQMVSERAKRILAGEWIQAEITHRKKDGTVFPVEITAGLLDLDEHKYILAFDRDITERKRMENLLIQSKTEWEDTFNTITDMITIHDRDFNIIRANQSAHKVLGLPLLEETKVKCYEYYHGKTSPPPECRSCECLETGQPTEFEMYEPHLDMFLEIRAIPRFDDKNQLIGLIHVIRDITERKKVEEALQRAEQMKMVGEWATALAHEIKNPLAGIKVSIEVLLDELDISEEDRTVVFKAVDEIKRIELLLKSLLNFAKPPKPQFTLTD
ncbi:MAG: PAS domain S-box protein, partial [Deltaproteobacteria bacterium]